MSLHLFLWDLDRSFATKLCFLNIYIFMYFNTFFKVQSIFQAIEGNINEQAESRGSWKLPSSSNLLDSGDLSWLRKPSKAPARLMLTYD